MSVRFAALALLASAGVASADGPAPGRPVAGRPIPSGPEQPLTAPALGFLCDGSTDEGVRLQALTDELAAAGGGSVVFPANRVCAIGSTWTLRTGVGARFLPNSWIRWVGGATGPIVRTDPAASVENVAVSGILRVDYGTGFAGSIVQINSSNGVSMPDGFLLAGSSTAATGLDLRARNTTGLDAIGTRNVLFGTFGPLRVPGTIGTARRFSGLDPSSGTPNRGAQVVTLNTLGPLQVNNVAVVGDDWVDWADSNEVTGFSRVSLTADRARGVDFGSRSASVDHGVYNNHYASLAVDTFANGATGRIPLRFGPGKANRVSNFFQDPVSETGPVTALPSAASYSVVLSGSNGNRIETRQRGVASQAGQFESTGQRTLPDGTAIAVPLDGTGEHRYNAAILILSSADVVANGMFYVKPKATGAAATRLAADMSGVASPYLEVRTGALTGSTGNARRVTVSAHTDGQVYVENRLGYDIAINLTFLGATYLP